MGNDGGSFAHRSEMVKMKKREKKVSNMESAKMRSTLCTLSKEPLEKPICICKLGNIYNKSQVVNKLVEKNMPKDGFSHIKKLKDVKEVQGELSCPVTQTEFNGINKFLFFWNCGHLVSEKATKVIKLGSKCLICDQ